MIHKQSKHKTLLTVIAVPLCFAALIYGSTGDLMRAVTALIAFTPCAYLLADSAAAADAELSLARRSIFVRTNSVLTYLGHTETIAFDCDFLRRTGSLDMEFPRIVTALRHMGLHPVLTTDTDVATAAQIGAAAGITDIRRTADPENAATSAFPVALVGLHHCSAHGSSIRISLRRTDSTSSVDAVILSDDLRQIPVLIRMARRTRAKIEQNEIFGHTLNFIALGLAAAGVLTPITGALWHVTSALILLLNAASLHSVGAREKKFAY